MPDSVDHKKNIIEARNVSFSYGEEKIIENITLDVHKGDYLGIVGPNGAGKTTFLKLILGLLEPSEGSIKLFGKDIKEFKNWEKIGYVPQKATSFDINFPVTALEVAMMGRYSGKKIFSRMGSEDMKIVQEALDRVGMIDYKNRLIGDLSTGQQQRIFIARALASQPTIMFLDEPTTGIDKKSQDDFYSLIKKLNVELHLTLVLVTHDIERILKEAMHIACVNRTLVCHSSPEEFLKNNPSLDISGHTVRVIEHHHS